jgi:uncharacterized hydrophobic protein (TIGR00271 family)
VNSSAVVIGAMLVAPLLAPILGLALALAVGDGRLAMQTGAVVLGSTLAVIAAAALLTVLLPFHTITLEISARVRPTTLDLAIAVFSGLAGALVTVARRSRLSAAIPGVAISVALIPPLAVAGFGIGIGRGDVIRGSLLLYGANLAGIVLSGMTVFMLIGMHRAEVLETARQWHSTAHSHGVTAWADRIRWIRSLGVFHSPWARVALVFAFAIALGLPLSETLAQIARETRLERAVGETAGALFNVPGRASILDRQTVLGPDRTQAYVRVATTQWFGADVREEFERTASAAAGEPVRLTLEQLPARGEDLNQLRDMLPAQDIRARTQATPVAFAELLVSARARLAEATEALVLPAAVTVLQAQLTTTSDGELSLGVAYAAAEPLPVQAAEMIRTQLLRALDTPEREMQLHFVSLAPMPLTAADTAAIDEAGRLLRQHPRLTVEFTAPAEGTSTAADAAIERLRGVGIAPERILLRRSAGGASTMRLRATPPSTAAAPGN